MAQPRKRKLNLFDRLKRIKTAGIQKINAQEHDPEHDLESLSDRVRQILQIIQDHPQKANEMTCLIMYDISDDKVRTQIAKYLERQGCTRIQKSVFLVRTENRKFQEIHETLRDVNSYYENADSIILAPVNSSDVRSMKLIGKNVQIEAIVDKPNTLFF